MRWEECLSFEASPLVLLRAHLDTHLLHWLWREQRSHLRYDWSIQSADNNFVALVQDTIGEHNVQRCPEPFDNLDLKHSALELRDVHELLAHALLREFDDEHEHVWDTLAGVCRCRDE